MNKYKIMRCGGIHVYSIGMYIRVGDLKGGRDTLYRVTDIIPDDTQDPDMGTIYGEKAGFVETFCHKVKYLPREIGSNIINEYYFYRYKVKKFLNSARN